VVPEHALDLRSYRDDSFVAILVLKLVRTSGTELGPRASTASSNGFCVRNLFSRDESRDEMTRRPTFVIVGGGLAGTTAADALRAEGFDGRVILIGDETERPYNRPPLSKDYLQGKSEKEKIYVHPERWYDDNDVELRLNCAATLIDVTAHQLTVRSGEQFDYDKLLLTTGSSPRHLKVPGSDLDGVLYLRRVADCEAIKAAFVTAKRVAIIGAGWIGLETAAAARAAGVEAIVLETAELPLVRVLGNEVAEIFLNLHTRHGVTMDMSVEVAEITGVVHRATGVRLGDGRQIDADVVVVGVGITPNTELAEAAGLTVDNGIVVDENLKSSDPDVFAAGDVANAWYPLLHRHLRLEHWSAALNQGPVAAANMMGHAVAYDRVPYFYSDQYDLGMEYSGFVESGHYDQIVFRGEVAEGKYIAFWLDQGRVLAGMNVNVWDVTDTIADLVRLDKPIDVTRLQDPKVPLEDLLRGALGV
jgi:3-phenylpropionate/trans-cinnamate dioxygenase ferredoxin reductase subunit